MSDLKKLASSTAIYGLSTIVGRTINFLLVPLQTNKNVMGESDYGVLSELYAYVAFFNVVYLFGMETTYFRFVNKIGEEKSFNSAMTIVLTISLLVSALLWFQSNDISDFFGANDVTTIIQCLIGIMLTDAVVAIPFARLRQQDKALKFAIIRLLNVFLIVGLNVFFLLVLPKYHNQNSFLEAIYIEKFALQYIFIANLIANSLFIPLLIKEIIAFRPMFEKSILKEAFIFAWPLVIVGLSGNINELVDRPMLRKLLPDNFYAELDNSKSAVGVYSAAYKLTMFITLANQAFRYAAEPFFFKKAKDKNAPQTFVTVMKYYIVLMSIAIVAISLLKEELATLFIQNDLLRTGLVVVPILLLANLFLGIYYNQSVWYKVTDKTKYGLLISIIGAVITITANLILIPIYGYLGAAIATFSCYFIMSTTSYLLGHQHYPIPYKIANGLLHVILVILSLVIHHFLQNKLENTFVEKAIVFITYILIVYLIEKRSIAKLLR